MSQTVSMCSRDAEGSLSFFSAVSFSVREPEDFVQSAQDWKQALSGLRASAQDIAIHQSRRLSRRQKESLLCFFQTAEEPVILQERLRA